mmetsp:Transcript_90949/g.208291  ORF Transcript_90949/g.208291 Transcript_90949/m.208291 type:complete len:360 (-) Transcript_90949:290-1369(-)
MDISQQARRAVLDIVMSDFAREQRALRRSQDGNDTSDDKMRALFYIATIASITEHFSQGRSRDGNDTSDDEMRALFTKLMSDFAKEQGALGRSRDGNELGLFYTSVSYGTRIATSSGLQYVEAMMQSTAKEIRTRDRSHHSGVPKHFQATGVVPIQFRQVARRFYGAAPSRPEAVPSFCEAMTRKWANRLLRANERPDLECGEELLWHGTSAEKSVSIIKFGFDQTKCQRSRVGQAVFFAESITKADEYTDCDHKIAWLVRVRVNRPAVSTARDPGSEERSLRQRAQQSTGCVLLDRQAAVGTFREWAMLDGSQTLPEFIVSYKTSSTPCTDNRDRAWIEKNAGFIKGIHREYQRIWES